MRLNSPQLALVILVLTLWLLFGSDIKLLATTASADGAFDVALTVCFVLLLAELVARMWLETEVTFIAQDAAPAPGSAVAARPRCCRPRVRVRGYAVSYLLLLDVASILSLVPDLLWIARAIESGSSADPAANNLATLRASRISRVGSRVGRILRTVRLLRLLRLSVVWSRYLRGRRADAQGGGTAAERWNEALHRESQMGTRLRASVAGGVIALVLLLMLLIPVCTAGGEDITMIVLSGSIHSLVVWGEPGWQAAVLAALASSGHWTTADGCLTVDSGSPRIVYASFTDSSTGASWVPVDYPDVYSAARTGAAALVGGAELQKVMLVGLPDALAYGVGPAFASPPLGANMTTVLYFNERPHVRVTAALSIALTATIIAVLAVGAMRLSADAQALVLHPIESIVSFVSRLSANPFVRISSSDNRGEYETQLVENTIKKVGTLLTVAFGPHGALVVSQYLNAPSGEPAPVKPPRLTLLRHDPDMPLRMLQPGLALHVVHLAVSIPHWDAILDVLGPRFSAWAGRLVKELQDAAVGAGGAPVGEVEGSTLSFIFTPGGLAVETARRVEESGAVEAPSPRSVRVRRMSMGATLTGLVPSPALLRNMALGEAATDLVPAALLAAMRMVAAVRRSRDVLDCAEATVLRESGQLPGFRPRLAIGLHASVSIEAVLGSSLKVNVAYGGPGGSIARACAELAPHYGAEILMTSSTALQSAEVNRMARPLDSVAGVGPVSVVDCWDWAASVPPAALRTDLMSRILPALARDKKFGEGQGEEQLQPPSLPRVDVAATWASAAASFCGSLSLPPFRLYAAGGGDEAADPLIGHNADLFDRTFRLLSDEERAVSVVGAADIKEHGRERDGGGAEGERRRRSGQHAGGQHKVGALADHPCVWLLRAAYPPDWAESAALGDAGSEALLGDGLRLAAAALRAHSAVQRVARRGGGGGAEGGEGGAEAGPAPPLLGSALDLPSRARLAHRGALLPLQRADKSE